MKCLHSLYTDTIKNEHDHSHGTSHRILHIDIPIVMLYEEVYSPRVIIVKA